MMYWRPYDYSSGSWACAADSSSLPACPLREETRADHSHETDLLALLHAGFAMRAPSPGPRLRCSLTLDRSPDRHLLPVGIVSYTTFSPLRRSVRTRHNRKCRCALPRSRPSYRPGRCALNNMRLPPRGFFSVALSCAAGPCRKFKTRMWPGSAATLYYRARYPLEPGLSSLARRHTPTHPLRPGAPQMRQGSRFPPVVDDL